MLSVNFILRSLADLYRNGQWGLLLFNGHVLLVLNLTNEYFSFLIVSQHSEVSSFKCDV